ncbi:hypothetical protein, partial [Listeria monocytogenes]|uniref:hypothetical protein n=1 Tax=Listeria monocytogenes TaxID=1639 RepID=UPI002FDC2264
PPKTGWIAFEDQKPTKEQRSKGNIAYGHYHEGQWQTYAFAWPECTHWLALPNPPERKTK